MEPDNKKGNAKQAYEKPMLRTIELAVEEVLVVGCKLSSIGFAHGVIPCITNNCAGPGS